MQKHLLLLITAFATQLAAGDWNAFDITMKGKQDTSVLKKACRSRERQAPAWHLGLKNTAKLELGVPGYYAKPF